ncbi:MAG: hypothetical protein ACUVR2_12265, partial [Anaerolineae bacterium]
CTVYDLQWLIQQLGVERILFGSDLPANIPVELTKYRTVHLNPEELAICLGGTAARLFHL